MDSIRSRPALRAVAVLFLAAAMSCEDAPTTPDPSAVFELEVSGETFRTVVDDPASIAGLDERLASGRRGVVIGELRRGDGDVNAPWGWHWAPATVHAADVAVELCDGRPSMVEADLDYWIDTVGSFCPWGALVVRRLP